MSTGGDHATWAFSQNFTSEFRSTRSELEKRLESTKACPTSDAIQALSTDIAKLAKALADAAGSLPSYDQKLYETQVNTLETSLNDLRVAAVPKPKFAFKRRTVAAPPPNPAELTKDALAPAITELSSPNSFISSHTHTYLTTASLVSPLPSSDLTISDLDHCILNLLPTNGNSRLDDISAIHLREISNSVLLLPIINGSILIHGLSHCVVVVGCHQFRMHASNKTDVFLSIASNPIIEDCHDIRFTSYPRAFLAPEQPESVKVLLAVQDFSHIRNTPSPNWVLVDSSEMNRPLPTKLLESASEVESSLREILPV